MDSQVETEFGGRVAFYSEGSAAKKPGEYRLEVAAQYAFSFCIIGSIEAVIGYDEYIAAAKEDVVFQAGLGLEPLAGFECRANRIFDSGTQITFGRLFARVEQARFGVAVVEAVVGLVTDEQGYWTFRYMTVIGYVNEYFVGGGLNPIVEDPEGILGGQGIGIRQVEFDINAL